MTTIYLLRHGALSKTWRERFVGQIDPPLGREGIRQAEALARTLSRQRIDAIFCSDLVRSQQTASIIATAANMPFTARRDLREIALGDWEGLLRGEVAEHDPDQFAARGRNIEHHRIPGGESFADCRERVLAAWAAIIRPEWEHMVIVGHAGINRLLLCHFMGIPVVRVFSLRQDYGCVNVIEQTAGETKVLELNRGCEEISVCV
jgi:probable phosphoglycerate mutase